MDRCPHIKGIYGRDEIYDYCELTEKPSGRIHPCVLITGETCPEWEEIKKEWWAENDTYAEVLAEDYGSGSDEN